MDCFGNCWGGSTVIDNDVDTDAVQDTFDSPDQPIAIQSNVVTYFEVSENDSSKDQQIASLQENVVKLTVNLAELTAKNQELIENGSDDYARSWMKMFEPMGAPPGARGFKEKQYWLANAVLMMLFPDQLQPLNELVLEFRSQLEPLAARLRAYMMNEVNWSKEGEEGGFLNNKDAETGKVKFRSLLLDWSNTLTPPDLEERQAIVQQLADMQAGVVTKFLAAIQDLVDRAFHALTGSAPDISSIKPQIGSPVQPVPEEFLSRSSFEGVQLADLSPSTLATFTKAKEAYDYALNPRPRLQTSPAHQDSRAGLTDLQANDGVLASAITAAEATSPAPLPYVDLKDSGVRAATLNFGKGGRGPAYRHYLVALNLVECAEYHDRLDRAIATTYDKSDGGLRPKILHGGLKGNARGNAKASEYQKTYGTLYPVHSHIKDFLRSTVMVVGHAGVRTTETALQEEFGQPFERKNRLASPTHDLVCVYRLASGLLVEVQISYTSVNALKSYAHILYEYARADTKGSLAKGDATCFGGLTDKARAVVKDPVTRADIKGYDDITPEDIKMPWI